MNKKVLLNGILSTPIFVSIFVILGIYLLTNVTNSFTEAFNGSVASNVSSPLEIINIPSSLGLISFIIFLGLVIGIMFQAFKFGSSDEEGDEFDEEDDEDEETEYTRRILERSIIPEIRESSEEKPYDKNKFEGKSKYD